MTQPAPVRPSGLGLRLRANLAQLSLLVGVNALAGLLAALYPAVWGPAAVWGTAAVAAACGLLVAVRMYETHRPMGPS